MSKLPPNACRLRVRYAKDGRLAYLGHLEVMNTVMRCVRRSGLPFEVGNGFARRMRIQFSQALPVGASSAGEYYDLLLSEPIDAEEALVALVAATPRALAPDAARILPRRIAALEAWANLSRWEVAARGRGLDARGFERGLAEVLSRGYIDYMRGDKPRHIELAGLVANCEVRDAEAIDGAAGGVDLVLETRSSERGALRPAVLVGAVCEVLGVARPLEALRVYRVGQWHECEDGTRLDPMDG